MRCTRWLVVLIGSSLLGWVGCASHEVLLDAPDAHVPSPALSATASEASSWNDEVPTGDGLLADLNWPRVTTAPSRWRQNWSERWSRRPGGLFAGRLGWHPSSSPSPAWVVAETSPQPGDGGGDEGCEQWSGAVAAVSTSTTSGNRAGSAALRMIPEPLSVSQVSESHTPDAGRRMGQPEEPRRDDVQSSRRAGTLSWQPPQSEPIEGELAWPALTKTPIILRATPRRPGETLRATAKARTARVPDAAILDSGSPLPAR